MALGENADLEKYLFSDQGNLTPRISLDNKRPTPFIYERDLLDTKRHQSAWSDKIQQFSFNMGSISVTDDATHRSLDLTVLGLNSGTSMVWFLPDRMIKTGWQN